MFLEISLATLRPDNWRVGDRRDVDRLMQRISVAVVRGNTDNEASAPILRDSGHARPPRTAPSADPNRRSSTQRPLRTRILLSRRACFAESPPGGAAVAPESSTAGGFSRRSRLEGSSDTGGGPNFRSHRTEKHWKYLLFVLNGSMSHQHRAGVLLAPRLYPAGRIIQCQPSHSPRPRKARWSGRPAF